MICLSAVRSLVRFGKVGAGPRKILLLKRRSRPVFSCRIVVNRQRHPPSPKLEDIRQLRIAPRRTHNSPASSRQLDIRPTRHCTHDSSVVRLQHGLKGERTQQRDGGARNEDWDVLWELLQRRLCVGWESFLAHNVVDGDTSSEGRHLR